jgi:hypothetical protein
MLHAFRVALFSGVSFLFLAASLDVVRLIFRHASPTWSTPTQMLAVAMQALIGAAVLDVAAVAYVRQEPWAQLCVEKAFELLAFAIVAIFYGAAELSGSNGPAVGMIGSMLAGMLAFLALGVISQTLILTIAARFPKYITSLHRIVISLTKCTRAGMVLPKLRH